MGVAALGVGDSGVCLLGHAMVAWVTWTDQRECGQAAAPRGYAGMQTDWCGCSGNAGVCGQAGRQT